MLIVLHSRSQVQLHALKRMHIQLQKQWHPSKQKWWKKSMKTCIRYCVVIVQSCSKRSTVGLGLFGRSTPVGPKSKRQDVLAIMGTFGGHALPGSFSYTSRYGLSTGRRKDFTSDMLMKCTWLRPLYSHSWIVCRFRCTPHPMDVVGGGESHWIHCWKQSRVWSVSPEKWSPGLITMGNLFTLEMYNIVQRSPHSNWVELSNYSCSVDWVKSPCELLRIVIFDNVIRLALCICETIQLSK